MISFVMMFSCWFSVNVYVHKINIPSEREIKDTKMYSISASYLNVLLNIDINGKLTRNFMTNLLISSSSLSTFPYMCSNFPISPENGVLSLN